MTTTQTRYQRMAERCNIELSNLISSMQQEFEDHDDLLDLDEDPEIMATIMVAYELDKIRGIES